MIAGLIQLIGLRRFSPIQLYAIGSGTAALLTFAMWKVGRAYSAALIDALRAGRPQVFPTVADDAPFNGRQVDAAAVDRRHSLERRTQDVRVRRAAVEILGDLPDQRRPMSCEPPSGTPTRRYGRPRFDRSPEPETPKASPVALEAMADPEPAVRLAAIRAVVDLDRRFPGRDEPVRGLLADPDPAVRATAACGHPARPRSRGCARRAASDAGVRATHRLRELAVHALEGSASSDTFEMETRRAARCATPAYGPPRRRALATSDPMRAVPLLVRSLGDDDAGVRRAVASSLGRIGTPSVEPAPRRPLRSRHPRRERCSRSSSCRRAPGTRRRAWLRARGSGAGGGRLRRVARRRSRRRG